MNNLILGILTILRWLFIACVLPIWYIGALQSDSLNNDNKVILGTFSVMWVLAFLMIVLGIHGK